MYCLLNLVHVSALTVSSSGRTLITSQNRLCQVVTMAELQSKKYIICEFKQSCLQLLKQYCLVRVETGYISCSVTQPL